VHANAKEEEVVKKSIIIIAAVIVGIVALVAWYQVVPSRLTSAQQQEALEAQRELDAIDAEEQTMNEETQEAAAPAPAVATKEDIVGDLMEQEAVRVKLTTSKGDVLLEVYPKWAPHGVRRLLELVQEDYFKDVKFFRVVTQPRLFVVQFGIAADPAVSAKWRDRTLPADPVKQANVAGTITYAQGSSPNTRTTQLFINLGDNTFLDGMGFAPIGKVIEGMDVVLAFNDQYQDRPTSAQGEIQMGGNAFLDKTFPGLDYIQSATIVEKEEPAVEAVEPATVDETPAADGDAPAAQ
jgi:cyclophilin family peptidyl-prolyl cis-trans isomerase